MITYVALSPERERRGTIRAANDDVAEAMGRQRFGRFVSVLRHDRWQAELESAGRVSQCMRHLGQRSVVADPALAEIEGPTATFEPAVQEDIPQDAEGEQAPANAYDAILLGRWRRLSDLVAARVAASSWRDAQALLAVLESLLVPLAEGRSSVPATTLHAMALAVARDTAPDEIDARADTAVSFHEAGHVVGALEEGVAIDAVTIRPHPASDCLGYVHLSNGTPAHAARDEAGRLEVERYVVTEWAGPCAQEFGPCDPPSPESWATHRHAVDRQLSRLLPARGDAETRALGDYLRERARAVIRRRWTDVVAIARALSDRHTLSADDVTAILATRDDDTSSTHEAARRTALTTTT